MAPRIYRHDARRARPSGTRGEMDDRLGVGEIGFEASGISAGCEGDSSVSGIRAVVRSDGVLVHEICGGGDYGAAVFGVRCPPHTGDRMDIELTRVTTERVRQYGY
jgi:hypothetical protein